MHLGGLLEPLEGLSDEEIEERGERLYRELYLNRGRVGVHRAHDGEVVLFHEDRFEHAFFGTQQWRWHPERKETVDRERVRRIRWIGEVISGRVEGSECLEGVWHLGREARRKRMYVVWDENYVVWLEPRRQGGWKFSTAYVASKELIRKYQGEGRMVSRWRKTPRD
jgi:hypothetical protein